MKHVVLLAAVVVMVMPIALQAQSALVVDWDHGNQTTGSETESVIVLHGILRNTGSTPVNVLFRYNLDAINPNHFGAFCFGTQCYPLFPGEDNPEERAPQYVAPNGGEQDIEAWIQPQGNKGTSTIFYKVYDRVDTTIAVSFSVTYYVGVTSVQEATELGISVYPTPAADNITIHSNTAPLVTALNLYAADGTLRRSYGVSGQEVNTLDVSGLASGTYHLMLTLANGAVTRYPISVVR